MYRILILESFPGSMLFIKHPDITQADGVLAIVIEISIHDHTIHETVHSPSEILFCKVGKQAHHITRPPAISSMRTCQLKIQKLLSSFNFNKSSWQKGTIEEKVDKTGFY